jgi:hypothetical protein
VQRRHEGSAVTASKNYSFRRRAPRSRHTSIQRAPESLIRFDEDTFASLGVEHELAVPRSSTPIPIASIPRSLSVVSPP